jgi:hypothetical protein
VIVSELDEQVAPVVLIIDDLHELRSAGAVTQLARLLAALPGNARMAIQLRKLAAEARPSPSGNDIRGRGQANADAPPGAHNDLNRVSRCPSGATDSGLRLMGLGDGRNFVRNSR